ncbi:MAG: ABC transporter ATP-binding protein [Candidatus Marsarchaeota archaeon]|nr:ABC transporter ATP-binding protein [Candidatus Marsarchaeota archaeon]
MALLEVKHVSVSFSIRSSQLKAVDNVDLSVKSGEVMGIVGESGSGKSTLGYSILKLLPRNAAIEGKVEYRGLDLYTLNELEMRKIRGKEIAMVFQGSMNSLNPLIKIERQVAEPIIVHNRLGFSEALSKARETLEKVGIDPSKGESYPHELSGGLKQRVAVAIALAANPSLLIADEPTTALDVMTQAQLMDLLKTQCRQHNMAMILISHDIALISESCDSIAVMYAGRVIESGPAQRVIHNPIHPYTRGLLASIPSIQDVGKHRESIPGDPPDPFDLPAGCRFRPRCSFATEACSSYDLASFQAEKDHFASCLMVRGGQHG